ncbi:hypothetical protein EJ077_18420 [Mesorhizobium sp. M8A.F.Ca.ET.057.01.1.1]|nr:hypothetical protein EJ077_18420 [Mesorhizobium sp. M8A.F.Ca.ET.057.01.1.1]RWE47473.1 MAG: hypothetical protein EOS80_11685 [Mesorhizobium sp.]
MLTSAGRSDPGFLDHLIVGATIEDHCPPGVLPSEEAVNCIYGPTLQGEAEAISAAIVATVERLQLRTTVKPPAPNIKV